MIKVYIYRNSRLFMASTQSSNLFFQLIQESLGGFLFVFGIISILVSFASTQTSMIWVSVFPFAAAVVALPSTNEMLSEKFNIKLAGILRIIAFVIFAALTVFLNVLTQSLVY